METVQCLNIFQDCLLRNLSSHLNMQVKSERLGLESESKASSLADSASLGPEQKPKGWGKLFSKRRQSPQKGPSDSQNIGNGSDAARKKPQPAPGIRKIP